ncbi:hypothetical protein DesyoDRAFT_3961 [Desulfosporosinus youngiae DSM 17734]|uniref:Uncharacterized protein n=2 Tax=Desulfosporosinus TaxID=79206 RepID=H5Y5Z5_9FIRM|nr:hypothetical protein DesyoDRAFT_3961 [Desulfosporosinus youngiae DSM 17734]
MLNIEKRQIINPNNLSGEFYFTSILAEVYANQLMSNSEIETIQMQCLKFLANKVERYNCGDSSSIKVETAESIMKSNLYTIGIYLKSFPDADSAVKALKSAGIPEMYQKGRALINAKIHSSKHIYEQVKGNKIMTLNYTYNQTLDDTGIGSFFMSYDPDYAAHEVAASFDYQLCNPITDLTGIEYIQKYLDNLLLENRFCSYFDPEKIHHLLSGYDEGYQDLLINIFEQVMTAAIGCILTNRKVVELALSKEEVQGLNYNLLKDDDSLLTLKICQASEKVLKELKVTSLLLKNYVDRSLPRITATILNAVRTKTLSKTFVAPVNPDLKPKIQFISGEKMDDKEYRKLIDELLICRYSSDKLALIKEKVRSFGDMEDILLDAELSGEEITSVLSILGDVEIAALIRKYPFNSEIEAVDLSEPERALRSYLRRYFQLVGSEQQERILEISNQLHRF